MRAVYLLIVACLQLEDMCLWLADRLEDSSHLQKSSSLYLTVAKHDMRPLEDMEDFFTKLLIYVLFVQFSQYSIYQNTISVFQLLNLKSHLSYQEPLVLIF